MPWGEGTTTDFPAGRLVGICLTPITPLRTFSYVSFGADIMGRGMPPPGASVRRSAVAGSQGERGGGQGKQFSEVNESFAHPSVTTPGSSAAPRSF